MTDLREALKSYFSNGGPDTPIRTTWHDGVEHWEAPASDIRELLAAHPVEPGAEQPWLMIHHIREVRNAGYIVTVPKSGAERAAQVEITDEAVEAAARTSFNEIPGVFPWDDLTDNEKDPRRQRARAGLAAALPYLAPRPLIDRDEADRRAKAARGYAWNDGPVVDAVLELARPMPTQEQIARAQYEQDVTDGRQVPNDWTDAGDIVRGAYLHAANAVLALLSGSKS